MRWVVTSTSLSLKREAERRLGDVVRGMIGQEEVVGFVGVVVEKECHKGCRKGCHKGCHKGGCKGGA